ncbi:Alpha/Beta hydrolase protein [Glomus cerebriforme]|uniref:acylaminoacyl-peptidase n=1 Tax=Glomus cerebriforme TaxID=658196 RepID=A0A397SDQ0_9GLOM|nr:Alpha/Beta hydrolase protein [Glomus cerebriforme]
MAVSEKSVQTIDDIKEDSVGLKTFKLLATIPTYAGVKTFSNEDSPDNPSVLSIQVILSQRDLNRKLKRNIVKQLVVSLPTKGSSAKVITSFLPIDLGDVILQAESPSRKKLLILRSVSNDKGKKKFVEVWNNGNLKQSIDVTDSHGDFYADATFRSLEWARSEEKAVYIAERKTLDEKDEKKHDFAPEWGERFANKGVSVIVVVNVLENKVEVLPEFKNIVPGQVFFGPEDKTLIFNGYNREPRYFGITACINRLNGIYQTKLDGTDLVHLTEQLEHARSPRLNPSETVLVYYSNPISGPHSYCSELREYNFSTNTHRTVVPIIRTPSDSFQNGFTGIYNEQMGRKPFITFDGKEFLVIQSYCRSRGVVLAINLDTGKVQNLTPTESWTLFIARNNYIIASKGAPNDFAELYIGIVTEYQKDTLKVDWTCIDKPNIEEVNPILSKITWSIIKPIPKNDNLEVIFIKPNETSKDEKPPLIVLPHGGPHGVITTDISLYNATFISLGYTIAIVNYTGSIGFGQDSIDALVGKAGDLDVKEVQASAQYFIDNELVNPNKVIAMGGSHGGFISAHLIGKYPDFYKACVMRNPVLNIGNMSSVTDIPDWCFSEIGLPYSLKHPPLTKPSDYKLMYENSPINNIDEVKTPTLLMLGTEDKRVPHNDGLNWYYYLKGKGNVEILCKTYKETGHSLDSIDAEVFGIDHIIKFLEEKIGINN